MKICPNCNSQVDDNFELCWNCQYSFGNDKIIDNSDFNTICPNCGIAIEPNSDNCPGCGYDLNRIKISDSLVTEGSRIVKCPHCNVRLNFLGNYKFQEGSKMGVLGDLFELFTKRESFDLYCCPDCGKVEFYLPGYA